ncbi:hypothetical protein GC098_07610 [Paenibacillus sp. LMG 31458]|uniref:Uncharacterized protein n=1 Tax=Paenibacillus phytorum TaxID=2654977 RepID=A0ABX1XSM9_9BACL|nr:hypothetical protein [Paenibacillus phytorum]NOU71289.1 hypothetical protein [Paenibacillus phytorum]
MSESDKLFFHLTDENQLVAASAVCLNAKIANDIRLSEMLIQKQAILDPNDLVAVGIELMTEP